MELCIFVSRPVLQTSCELLINTGIYSRDLQLHVLLSEDHCQSPGQTHDTFSTNHLIPEVLFALIATIYKLMLMHAAPIYRDACSIVLCIAKSWLVTPGLHVCDSHACILILNFNDYNVLYAYGSWDSYSESAINIVFFDASGQVEAALQFYPRIVKLSFSLLRSSQSCGTCVHHRSKVLCTQVRCT